MHTSFDLLCSACVLLLLQQEQQPHRIDFSISLNFYYTLFSRNDNFLPRCFPLNDFPPTNKSKLPTKKKNDMNFRNSRSPLCRLVWHIISMHDFWMLKFHSKNLPFIRWLRFVVFVRRIGCVLCTPHNCKMVWIWMQSFLVYHSVVCYVVRTHTHTQSICNIGIDNTDIAHRIRYMLCHFSFLPSTVRFSFFI